MPGTGTPQDYISTSHSPVLDFPEEPGVALWLSVAAAQQRGWAHTSHRDHGPGGHVTCTTLTSQHRGSPRGSASPAATQKGGGCSPVAGSEEPPPRGREGGRDSIDSRAKYTKLKARTAFSQSSLHLIPAEQKEGAGGAGQKTCLVDSRQRGAAGRGGGGQPGTQHGRPLGHGTEAGIAHRSRGGPESLCSLPAALQVIMLAPRRNETRGHSGFNKACIKPLIGNWLRLRHSELDGLLEVTTRGALRTTYKMRGPGQPPRRTGVASVPRRD